jgi:hypothetical protein
MTSNGETENGTLQEKESSEPGEVLLSYRDNGFLHRLKDISGELHHDWIIVRDHEKIPVANLKGEDLLDAAIEQASCISLGRTEYQDLYYQAFPRWDEKALTDLERGDVKIGVVPEGRGQRIRITSAGSRYEIIYQKHLLRDPSPSYILSRLNARDYDFSVDLLGMSYWKLEGRNIPWMMMIRYPEGTSSGFSPYLSDLNKLLGSAVRQHREELRSFLFDLTRSGDRDSYVLSRELGRAIGKLQGCLILDSVEHGKGDTEGERIIRLFSRSKLDMQEIGSDLGRISVFIDEVNKGLIKVIGNRTSVPGGRKQRVVRSLGQNDPIRGLSLLRTALNQRQKNLRERFSGIRRFKGSPLVPSGLDSSLDHMDLDSNQKPYFRKFDWTFHDQEGGRITKVLPLKDLALVLNSLKKARYLSSMRIMERATRGRDMGRLDLMFLEYNLAKKGYNSMMSDLNAFLHVRRRDIPFRYVFLTSIVSSIWYEKNRNSLILGYNEGLSGTENEDLLIYPRGADTLEGIKLMQILTSLSSASGTLSEGIKSRVGLESDILTALSV